MTLLTVEMVSEAIRKNGVEQVFGSYVNGTYQYPTGACAIGQAYLNLMDEEVVVYDIYKVEFHVVTPSDIRAFLDLTDGEVEPLYGVVKRARYTCPFCGDRMAYLGNMVVHLNDDEHLNFEQIADYIDNRAQYKVPDEHRVNP